MMVTYSGKLINIIATGHRVNCIHQMFRFLADSELGNTSYLAKRVLSH